MFENGNWQHTWLTTDYNQAVKEVQVSRMISLKKIVILSFQEGQMIAVISFKCVFLIMT